MMSLTKYVKEISFGISDLLSSLGFYLILIIGLTTACCDSNSDDFKKTCPYELEFTGHYLRIPITIVPHKITYKVGDTIQINTIFTDSIYDLGTQRTFQIKGFPFKPLSLLYRFTSDTTYDSGFRVNELLIDTIYNSEYNFSAAYADGFNARTLYDGSEYKFESQLVLSKPGRYILLFTDLYQNHLGSGNSGLNAEADAITFEGKCPTLKYFLCSMIDSGDDNLKQFEPELVYLDNNVYRGRLRYQYGNALDALYPGGTSVEFSGFFGFEVLE